MKDIFYKTLHHYFPKLNRWISNLPDPRQQKSTRYRLNTLIWVGIKMFLLKLGSRRSINFRFNDENFIRNLSKLCKKAIAGIPNDVTLSNLLKRIDPACIQEIVIKMLKTLLKKRVLEKFRLFGYYLVAIDGSGHLSFKKRHCPYCLERKQDNGVRYMHQVLSARLVARNGLSLPMGSEFINNKENLDYKQDCELKAFYRLLKMLKDKFSRTKICLLLDGLYANKRVFDICSKNKWKYIIVLKKGSIKSVYKEFEALKECSGKNIRKYETENVCQTYRWVNRIFYQDHYLNVLECLEFDKKKKKETKFLWILNYKITKNNCVKLGNYGGRLRWKIENEGFNSLKNGGYNMEHAYSHDIVGLKNFYYILQIAHMINQLIEKGSLIRPIFKSKIGSIENIARQLLESLKKAVIDVKTIENERFQVRLDTS